MRAVQLVAPKTFEWVEVEQPKPADGECLIRIDQVSVCGSDIYLEWAPDLGEEHYPLTPGSPNHECAGVVVESRAPSIKEGQRVIVIPRKTAGLAEYTVQSPDRIISLPDWGGLDEWVMCQHSGTVLYSAKHWGNPMGKRIAVLGQGGIGLSFTMIAEKQGALQVIGLDLEDYRLRKSLELGATHTINPKRENLEEALQEITKGEGVDFFVDASADPNGLDTCVKMVKRMGTVIGFSLITPETAPISHRVWMGKQVKVIPTVVAAGPTPVQEIREIVALRDRGWIDPGKLKTHNSTWSEVSKAYQMYADHADGVIKVAMAVDAKTAGKAVRKVASVEDAKPVAAARTTRR
ncbi:MAG: zinc-binding dehydrogenase [Chloroflexi bacterium]|nr:zinc-binding dehydrogenase [Chloroflexota bacterium]